MMRTIRNIFPPHIDPFIGGLGNREQDAIAYRAAGVSYKNIYLIDTTSKVHRMNNTTNSLTYKHMSDNFSDVFSSHLFNRVKSKSDVFQDSTKFKKN
jgi:phosphatidate phosphatase PAH1